MLTVGLTRWLTVQATLAEWQVRLAWQLVDNTESKML